MSPTSSDQQSSIIIRPSTGLMALPNGTSSTMSEIMSRSLAHIQTDKSLATRQRAPGEECDFEIAPGGTMRMCWIPPGEFLMGSPEDELGRYNSESQHRVTITLGFWMAKYQVTQAQWEAVMGSNPSYFKGVNLPVETVSSNDIAEPGGFLEKVNRVATGGGKFSLPTEAQWEYACRAGTTTALNNGKNLTSTEGACRNLDEVSWYRGNSDGKTHPGGLKKANAWGLHDMHGNLSEWCWDWRGTYAPGAQTDPRGAASGSVRAFRGGGWDDSAYYCRAASRYCYVPSGTGSSIGFRVVRCSSPSSSR